MIRAPKVTAHTYERDRPRELVHMDVKKLGKSPGGGGWRAHGQTTMNHPSGARNPKVGCEYVHSLVDDYSMLAYSEFLPGEKGTTCPGFLTRAAAYCAGHGISQIERVVADNAWAYRHNGEVERLNRTLQTERAYRRVLVSNSERTVALAAWIECYNPQRRDQRTERTRTRQPPATNLMARHD